MNGSMSIFPLEAFGQSPSLPIGSTTGDGDDAFAETLAAALAASTSTAVMPTRSAETGLDVRQSDADMPAAGQLATGPADLQKNAEAGPGVTGAQPQRPATTTNGARQAAGVVPTDPMQYARNEMTSAVVEGGSLDLDGSLPSSTMIPAFDRLGLADEQASSPVSVETATEITSKRPREGAMPIMPSMHDGDPVLDDPRFLHQARPAPITSARDALATIAGAIDSENPLLGSRAGEPAVPASIPEGRNAGSVADLISPAGALKAFPQQASRQAQSAAAASMTQPGDLAGAAPSLVATSMSEAASARPLPRQATSGAARPSGQGAVDPLNVDVRRDSAALPVSRTALEPAQPMESTGERQVAIAAGAPTTVDARASFADGAEPVSATDAGPRESGAHGSPVAGRGVDSRPTQAVTPAGAAIQVLAADADAQPVGNILGFERLQPALFVEGAVSDVGRFEPAATPGSSRAQALATGTAPAAQVALQIVRALPGGFDRFSLHLHPAELGSVDIQLTFEGQGRMSALITAERPETLELLQRDGRLLERSLGDSGLKLANDGLSFALKQDQQQQQGQSFQEQAQTRQAAFRAGRAYDDASDNEQLPPAQQVDRLRLLDIHT